MASRSPLVVHFRIFDLLIANITETGAALLTIKQVFGVLLAIDLITFGTLDARSDIHMRIFVKTHKLFNHFLVHFRWQLFARIFPMGRILFVMLVSFGLLQTLPAEVLETFCALNLGAPTSNESYGDAAFRIWTLSGTLFDVNFVESQGIFSIFIVNFFHLILKFV